MQRCASEPQRVAPVLPGRHGPALIYQCGTAFLTFHNRDYSELTLAKFSVTFMGSAL
jgi:hypothetical protein